MIFYLTVSFEVYTVGKLIFLQLATVSLPVSLTLVINTKLRIYPRIFVKIRNGPNGTLRGLGETGSEKNKSPNFYTFKKPKSIQGINSASLCSLAGRYDYSIPTRFLAPIDCLKIPALKSKISCQTSS
jgi:hypothetical protein